MADYKFLVNQRYIGQGSMSQPTGAAMWFDFKQFMTSAPPAGPGWTVKMSAAGSSISLNGDVITSPDAANGGMGASSVWWVMRDPAGVRELLFYKWRAPQTVTDIDQFSEMQICYSATEHFDQAGGHGGPIAADRPPIAPDGVWLGQPDSFTGTGPRSDALAVDLLNMGYVHNSYQYYAGITSNDGWELNVCADADPPHGFYLFTNDLTNTMAFLALDPTVDAHSADRDQAVLWHFIHGNAPADGSSGYNLMTPSATIPHLGGWNRKPQVFRPQGGTVQNARQIFANAIAANTARFLPLAVPYYWLRPDIYGRAVIPRGLPPSIYSGNDEGFPLIYVRNEPYNPTPNSPPIQLVMPPAYKGTSSMFRLIGSPRNNFDMMNIGGDRTHIILGTPGTIIAPWNGSTLIQG